MMIQRHVDDDRCGEKRPEGVGRMLAACDRQTPDGFDNAGRGAIDHYRQHVEGQ
jgi:hypothetical protein